MRQHLQRYSISVSQVCYLVTFMINVFLMHHILTVPKNNSAEFDVRSFCLNRK
jgi:hypothetical protein